VCKLCAHLPFPALVCVVRVEGTPYLCQTDEVGEICVSSGSTGLAYYGLPGMTKNIFEVSVFISVRVQIRVSVCSFECYISVVTNCNNALKLSHAIINAV